MSLNMVRLAVVISCLFVVFRPSVQAQSRAVPTKILVRAISRDAKVIGTKVGGARITIRDVSTGAVLSQGIQQGGTGRTDLIMKTPRQRGAKIYDTPGTAGFLATLNLRRPTVVEISAEGPLDTPQSTYKASKTLLLVPGQNVLGEGVLLEIHGFRIRLLAPTEDTHPTLGQDLQVRATITMA